MSRVLMLLLVLFSSCAYSVPHTGTIRFSQHVVEPRDHMGMPVAHYMDAKTSAVFGVENGSDTIYSTHLKCVDKTEHSIRVPAYSVKYVDVIATLRDHNICWEIEESED